MLKYYSNINFLVIKKTLPGLEFQFKVHHYKQIKTGTKAQSRVEGE